MLISHKWIKNYLPELDRFSTTTIAESLTISLAEVEQILPIRQELSNIVVGEVIGVKKHENSDKLSICQVTKMCIRDRARASTGRNNCIGV